MIWQGPVNPAGKPFGYGLERGASLAGLAAISTVNDATTGQPFPITVSWLGTWLQRNPTWNRRTLTYARFARLYQQSRREFTATFAASNPDLSAFNRHGGKIIIWHGLADQLIFPQGTIRYYQQLEHTMGGADRSGSFARLFLAPGAQHCASAAGSAPSPGQPMAALVNWVEKGKAPDTIPGELTNPVTGAAVPSRPLLPVSPHRPLHGARTAGPVHAPGVAGGLVRDPLTSCRWQACGRGPGSRIRTVRRMLCSV